MQFKNPGLHYTLWQIVQPTPMVMTIWLLSILLVLGQIPSIDLASSAYHLANAYRLCSDCQCQHLVFQHLLISIDSVWIANLLPRHHCLPLAQSKLTKLLGCN